MTGDAGPEWLRANRANREERAAIHLGPRGCGLSRLRAGGHDLDAIAAAELGLGGCARFVAAEVHAAPAAVPPPHGFDMVFTTSGTIGWLSGVGRRRPARLLRALLPAQGRRA